MNFFFLNIFLVAKCVADKLNHDNILLIASTAHYGKFPETIYSSLYGNHNLPITEILSKFEKEIERPKFHKNLNILHKTPKDKIICKTKDEIVKEILKIFGKEITF